MTINFATLEIELSKKIKTTTDPYDLLLYSKVLENLKHNLVSTVSTYSLLPTLSSASNGDMVYVESERVLYIADKSPSRNMWRRAFDDFVTIMMLWGSNLAGKLGDNSAINRSSPVSVSGIFKDWNTVDIGNFHGVALRTNGTAWAWGCGGNGRLGTNSTATTSSPVSIVGGFTDWCQVSAGGGHSSGVRTNGTAWAWGCNVQGALGDNTTVSKSSPVSVVGGFTDWKQVISGRQHTIGIRTNNTLWAWGYNTQGQLGDCTTTAKSSPVSVVGGFTDWCQVSAGYNHNLAVRANGTAWAWGRGTFGTLGDNTSVDKSSPVSVIGGFTDWCQTSGGNNFSVGIRSNGTIWAWGQGGSGQLGNNSTSNSSSPVSVVGGFTDWCQASSGWCHSIAIRTNGTLWAWGYGLLGRLGDNAATNRSSPVSVVGGFTDWCQISAENNFSAGIRKSML